jgi:hypothetical protein
LIIYFNLRLSIAREQAPIFDMETGQSDQAPAHSPPKRGSYSLTDHFKTTIENMITLVYHSQPLQQEVRFGGHPRKYPDSSLS